ncbi:uncharacterized protein METZ01_LOCUS416580, partial [marine metagenome]
VEASRENWDGEVGLVARLRAQLEAGTDGENGQAGRLGAIRRMGGLSGQESGGLNRPSRDIESMERRFQRLRELYPEFEGASLSEYVEALSKKSTSEVK